MELLFWFVIMIVFALAEAVTVGLTAIWFGVGALGALLVAGAGGEVWLQVTVFLVLSGLVLVLLRPVARRYLTPGYEATNADRIIGAQGVVTEEIDNLRSVGQVSISGQVWTARSEHNVVIPAETQVKVLRIEGVKVFVET